MFDNIIRSLTYRLHNTTEFVVSTPDISSALNFMWTSRINWSFSKIVSNEFWLNDTIFCVRILIDINIHLETSIYNCFHDSNCSRIELTQCQLAFFISTSTLNIIIFTLVLPILFINYMCHRFTEIKCSSYLLQLEWILNVSFQLSNWLWMFTRIANRSNMFKKIYRFVSLNWLVSMSLYLWFCVFLLLSVFSHITHKYVL